MYNDVPHIFNGLVNLQTKKTIHHCIIQHCTKHLRKNYLQPLIPSHKTAAHTTTSLPLEINRLITLLKPCIPTFSRSQTNHPALSSTPPTTVKPYYSQPSQQEPNPKPKNHQHQKSQSPHKIQQSINHPNTIITTLPHSIRMFA